MRSRIRDRNNVNALPSGPPATGGETGGRMDRRPTNDGVRHFEAEALTDIGEVTCTSSSMSSSSTSLLVHPYHLVPPLCHNTSLATAKRV